MRQTCTNCHFFGKGHKEKGSDEGVDFYVSIDERKTAISGNNKFTKSQYSVRCLMGVWDERFNTKDEDIIYRVAHHDRKGKCFFFPFDEGMMLDAAKELQKRSQEYSQLRRSNMYTRIGLWVAALALIINAIIGFTKS